MMHYRVGHQFNVRYLLVVHYLKRESRKPTTENQPEPTPEGWREKELTRVGVNRIELQL